MTNEKKSEEKGKPEEPVETQKKKKQTGKKNKPAEGEKKKRRKPSGSSASHLSTLDMVLEAIDVIRDPKGASVQSIKNYIMTQHNMESNMLRHLLKRAFQKGLNENALERPPVKTKEDEEPKPLSLLAGRYFLVGKSQSKPTKRQTDIAAMEASKKSKGKKKRKAY